MIDILVPTLGRRDALAPLMRNVRETTAAGDYRVTFVVDVIDEPSQEEIQGFLGGDFDICLHDGTYPQKANAGVRATAGEFVLPTGDDVVFHDGWFDAALARFSDPELQVVGTSDLTPATADEQHATMPIVRRAYIDGPGAAFNEPGVLYHEGYHHNFVETELWQLAVRRRVATFEPASVIEHRHPAWGTREADATDAKGNGRNWERDEELFLARRRAWMR